MVVTCGAERKTAAAVIISVILSLQLSVLLSQPHEQYRNISRSWVSSYILVTERTGEGAHINENNRQRPRHGHVDSMLAMPLTPSDTIANITNEEDSPPITLQNEPAPALHSSLSSLK